MRTALLLGYLALVAATAGCGGSPINAGDAARPTESRGDEALGEARALKACKPGLAESFVVDLDSNQRSDLELAMKDGHAVVAYDCMSFKILKDCRSSGTYAYTSVTPKEDVVKLASRDEVAANLPVLGAKLSAGLERGKSIDIALVTVGKRRSTRMEAIQSELQGKCDGATHVVRGAYIGAFALTSGSVGEVRASAEVFGAAVGGSSKSEKQVGRADGDPAACKKAEGDAPAPPQQCGAPIRVELVPVTVERKDENAAKAAEKAEEQGTVQLACAEGFVRVGGKCVEASKGDALGCDKGSEQCVQKCERGDGTSCFALARFYEGQRIGPDGKTTYDAKAKDAAKAKAFYDKACNTGHGNACSTLAFSSDAAGMKTYFDKGCAGGDAYACWWLAGREDTEPTKARTYAARGCNLGRGSACGLLGSLLVQDGKLDLADKEFARGCATGGYLGSDVCLQWGNLYARGLAAPKNPAKAMAAYQKACDNGSALGCHALGSMYRKGIGGPADAAKARATFEKGCDPKAPGWDACLSLGEMLEKGEGGPKDLAKAAEVYQRGCAKGACARAGKLYEKGVAGKPELDKAIAAYERGCKMMSRRETCEPLGVLLLKQDKPKGVAHYEDVCKRMQVDWACDGVKKSGGTLPADLKVHPEGKLTPQCVTPFTCTDAEHAEWVKLQEQAKKKK